MTDQAIGHAFVEPALVRGQYNSSLIASGASLPIEIQQATTISAFRHVTCRTAPHMDYRVSYEHSLKNDPDAFIVRVPSQRVDGIPASVPRDLLPEYITELILQRSPAIGRIRNLRVL